MNRLRRFFDESAEGLAAVELEHVEDHKRHWHRLVALEHPPAQPLEGGAALAAEGDELAVEHTRDRQRRELG